MASVEVSDRIGASADRVWDLVRDFGGIQRFADGVESVSVVGEGVGAVRTVVLPGGLTFQERLEALDDASRTLQYSVVGSHSLPFDQYLATVRLSEDGDGCRVEWSGSFVPHAGSESRAERMVQGTYRSLVAGLARALGGG